MAPHKRNRETSSPRTPRCGTPSQTRPLPHQLPARRREDNYLSSRRNPPPTNSTCSNAAARRTVRSRSSDQSASLVAPSSPNYDPVQPIILTGGSFSPSFYNPVSPRYAPASPDYDRCREESNNSPSRDMSNFQVRSSTVGDSVNPSDPDTRHDVSDSRHHDMMRPQPSRDSIYNPMSPLYAPVSPDYDRCREESNNSPSRNMSNFQVRSSTVGDSVNPSDPDTRHDVSDSRHHDMMRPQPSRDSFYNPMSPLYAPVSPYYSRCREASNHSPSRDMSNFQVRNSTVGDSVNPSDPDTRHDVSDSRHHDMMRPQASARVRNDEQMLMRDGNRHSDERNRGQIREERVLAVREWNISNDLGLSRRAVQNLNNLADADSRLRRPEQLAPEVGHESQHLRRPLSVSVGSQTAERVVENDQPSNDVQPIMTITFQALMSLARAYSPFLTSEHALNVIQEYVQRGSPPSPNDIMVESPSTDGRAMGSRIIQHRIPFDALIFLLNLNPFHFVNGPVALNVPQIPPYHPYFYGAMPRYEGQQRNRMAWHSDQNPIQYRPRQRIPERPNIRRASDTSSPEPYDDDQQE